MGIGRMGREVEAVARARLHETVTVPRGAAFPKGCVVGIDFTTAATVVKNAAAALGAGARYVVGTTGWEDRLPEVLALVSSTNGGLVHASNFSLGVNLFYRIVADAARLMARIPEYDPYVLERHHRLKKDAPSGTAKVLTRILEGAGGTRKRGVSSFDGPIGDDSFHVSSVRAGGVVGDHTVGFDSGVDEILLEHRARSRQGFALGAVLAAEWVSTRSGVHGFDAVLDDLLKAG